MCTVLRVGTGEGGKRFLVLVFVMLSIIMACKLCSSVVSFN